ncbi:hypothetical protein [Pseudomonas japonica]|uniref:hypothetical protein n=1 Tax=Pseudomonas japonica TaxID=256466 RepID=UPI003A879B89
MTTTSQVTFTETSLSEALSAVRGLHDMSTELIAAEVFRQLLTMDSAAAAHLGHDQECQRRHLVDAEGCKPEISIRTVTSAAAGTVAHDLNQAEGEQPDLNSPIHPDDMSALTERHREFLELGEDDWPDAAISLQDQAYCLGLERGKSDAALDSASGDLTESFPTVAVEGDQLVIRITTECLLHAVTCSPEWPLNYTGSPITIDNGPLLIQELIHELQRENEDGTNALHRLFDSAAPDAVNNGSQAVCYDNEVQP